MAGCARFESGTGAGAAPSPAGCTKGAVGFTHLAQGGLLLLKSLRNLSDEEVVAFWSESAYAQYFRREREMRWGTTCEPSKLTH